MKFSIEINVPINRFTDLYVDKNNYEAWKKDFIRYEPVSGLPEEVGAITKLIFKRVTLMETITSKNLPSEISEKYEHKRGDKTALFHKTSNRFSEQRENKTLLETEMVITKVIGFFPRIIMTLMAGAGKKYALDQLKKFKAFAERQTANR